MERPQKPLSMHPKKFALWLFLVTVVMIFAALTSAYIVRKGDGNWLNVEIPSIFWVNTLFIVTSSVTMHLAYLSAKKNNFGNLKLYIIITSILGISFLVGQFIGWGKLVDMGVFFGGKESNPAGSFVYVFTGLHGFHLISGVFVLLVVLVKSFRLEVHSKNMTLIEMCATYWHFLDGLWVYLFIFLLLNH
ncbi:MAG TPA: cytochrome c oxidase subunit 3 [Cytophagaceae bacterium]